MDSEARITQLAQGPPVFVVSGGPGASGELLARTILAQFPQAHVPLIIESRVLTEDRVRQIVAKAATCPAPSSCTPWSTMNTGAC